MEIERKWLVSDWPKTLPLIRVQHMEQGYLSRRPTVRIRLEKDDHEESYVLCVKSSGRLSREEIEVAMTKEQFEGMKRVIGKPLIAKCRRSYALPDGHVLEVNCVEENFWYAEVEFETEAEAEAFDPGKTALSGYFQKEVTGIRGWSMGEYWEKTRF